VTEERRDVLFCLGAFPWFGKADTPCCRCDERATTAIAWLFLGEPIVLQVCAEHAIDAEEWIRCRALWLTGASALKLGEPERPQVGWAKQLFLDFSEVG